MGNYQIETSAGYNQATQHNLLYGWKLAGYVESKADRYNYDVAACLDQCWWSQFDYQLDFLYYFLSKQALDKRAPNQSVVPTLPQNI